MTERANQKKPVSSAWYCFSFPNFPRDCLGVSRVTGSKGALRMEHMGKKRPVILYAFMLYRLLWMLPSSSPVWREGSGGDGQAMLYD